MQDARRDEEVGEREVVAGEPGLLAQNALVAVKGLVEELDVAKEEGVVAGHAVRRLEDALDGDDRRRAEEVVCGQISVGSKVDKSAQLSEARAWWQRL